MITLRVEVPYASFRKSYARSFAETYPLPPPATVYGMLLSLVGERFRRRSLIGRAGLGKRKGSSSLIRPRRREGTMRRCE